MPANRNALIRYKTIDKCLQNPYRSWTLEDLIEACSEALYEYEGIDKGVSRRTIQADIQLMRSDKLGYNAPIIVVDKKYYKYENSDYSITNIPLTDQDLEKLNETVNFLKQFQGFSHFKELDGMIQKLEDHVYSKKTNNQPIIDFEKNENLKGLEFLDIIYNSIINKKAFNVEYKSFRARLSNTFIFFPYLLKEFRNRWFVIGLREKDKDLRNLALDRILTIKVLGESFIAPKNFNTVEYFKNVIGVTVSPNQKPEKIVLFITKKHAPYVLTKPFHWSQKLIKEEYFGITIELNVQHNFELEKEILGFGDGVKVIAPERLRRNIKNRISTAIESYQTDISDKGISNAIQLINHKGYCAFYFVYTNRVIKRINRLFRDFIIEIDGDFSDILIEKESEIEKLLYNESLHQLMKQLDENLMNTANRFIVKSPEDWRQLESECFAKSYSVFVFLNELSEKSGYFELIPGSQNKVLDKDEIEFITQNSYPHKSKIPTGGVLIMDNLLLHRFVGSVLHKKTKLIQLEFAQRI